MEDKSIIILDFMPDYNFTFEYFKTEQGYRMKCVCIHNNKKYQANQQKATNSFNENKIKQDLIEYINITTDKSKRTW